LAERREVKRVAKRHLIAIVVAILVVIAAVACYYVYYSPRPSVVAKEIKIGLLFSYSGVMADVGKTQRDGALLAINEINEAGGLNMPWGKTKVTYVSADDETNADVATRRFWELVEKDKVCAVVGSCFAPIVIALNEQSKKAKVVYGEAAAGLIPVMKKDVRSPYILVPMAYAYSIGYAAAAYSIEQGWKRIYFLSRSDTWGRDMQNGVLAAIKDLGGELVGLDEAPLGAPDFTSYLLKVKQARPDVFIFAQFGADAVNVLKQARAMGLNEVTRIFVAWITNAVAVGVPPEALEGVYALHYFYWNLTGFPDQEYVKQASAYVENYIKAWGYPPDSYATAAYIVTKEILRGIELAGSTDADKIIAALESNPQFTSPKGAGKWRIAHDVEWKYGFFVVQGKGPAERKGLYDLFKVVGYYTGERGLPSLKELGYQP
jgi:branched-chain amino acid transport system substrate-binding protein